MSNFDKPVAKKLPMFRGATNVIQTGEGRDNAKTMTYLALSVRVATNNVI